MKAREIPQRTRAGSNRKWSGLEEFSGLSRYLQTQTCKKQPVGELEREGCRGSWAISQAHPAAGRGLGTVLGCCAGTGAGLAQALPLWQKLSRQLHLHFLPEKWGSSLRKQIWEGNKKHKMWLLQHKIGDTVLKCMLRGLEYNSFPKHNTLLCSSASLEDSAVQKGESFSSRSWLKQTCLFLNS